ncbi:MAG: helix-turn-helix domain-containing protein [Cephaloticoccus sp.]|nr:helix-turn-helix domain-containing protein [Cephaloticoccus sp.]MCF7759580.1 helix-turn-helix domain-containing protein [Cephaloticoccus sp.]
MDFVESGSVIRKARRQAGLTQADLAKRLGMSRTTLSQVETGVISELGIRKFAQICNRLGLEIKIGPRHPKLTLHEAYDKNRQERQAAFRQTDSALAQSRKTGAKT